MKKTLLIVLLIFTSTCTFSQTISETDKRFYFFKIWNFTKYYHPDLASGKINADTLFFRNLDIIDGIKDRKNYNAFIASFLSELSTSKTPKIVKDDSKKILSQNLDQEWFKSDKLFTAANRKKLTFIFKNRYIGTKHHYIPELRYTPEIPNEIAYKFPDTVNLPYPMRMLTLAKLQGISDYLFPHKYLTDKNLDSVIKQNIPLFKECNSRIEYEKLLLKVTSSFNDTHSYKFVNQLKNRKQVLHNGFFPPFNYTVFENEIVVTDIIIPERCEQGDIKSGDIITAINNQPIHQIIDSLSTLLSASNRNAMIHRLSNYPNNLVWPADSKNFSLTIRRGTLSSTKDIAFIAAGDYDNAKKIVAYLNKDDEPIENKLSILEGGIAYFKINKTEKFIKDVPDEQIDKAMDSLLNIAVQQKGIIFDMRGYPDWGGFIPYYILKKFGKTPFQFADYYEVNKQQIGTFILNDDIDTYHKKEVVGENTPYTGKVVIIVNSETLSMSEFFTMLLQNLFPQSITIGEQSAGADGDEKVLNLPGNYEFHFTGNAIFYRDGTNAQRKGVKINKPVMITPEDISSRKDRLLDNAVQLIHN